MTDERLPVVEGERDLLVATLAYLRRSFLRNLDDLDDEALRRPGVPSGTSLLGLAQHLAFAEALWLVHVFEGSDDALPSDRVPITERTTASVLDEWTEVAARTEAIVHQADLDARSARPRHDELVSLRWILVHLVEELARHAGHADIIREQIDGAVGR